MATATAHLIQLTLHVSPSVRPWPLPPTVPKDPDTFRAEYDEFLSSTGIYDAYTLASRFGIDTHNVEFWRSSLDISRKQIGEFEVLVG